MSTDYSSMIKEPLPEAQGNFCTRILEQNRARWSSKQYEKFMRENAEFIEWFYVCSKFCLYEDFIREMADYVDWTNICTWKRLTEEFIREFQDRVNWHMVSRYQKLSWKFIKEFQDKINFNMLTINEHIQGDIWKKCDENNYFKD